MLCVCDLVQWQEWKEEWGVCICTILVVMDCFHMHGVCGNRGVGRGGGVDGSRVFVTFWFWLVMESDEHKLSNAFDIGHYVVCDCAAY